MIHTFARNGQGQDFVVGDIHGHFDKLHEALHRVGFNPAFDRLFSVGDLVDRGPDSLAALDWLDHPWFFAVRGNHEQMAINFADGHNHPFQYERNGGRWFIDLDEGHQRRVAARFECLPLGIEVDTAHGSVGIVHAEVAGGDWERLRIPGPEEVHEGLWARKKIEVLDTGRVAGIDRVFVGHTPVRMPVRLGNVHYIDTGVGFGGPVTLVCITDPPQE